jgi:hemerythrin-like domain-containing protein
MATATQILRHEHEVIVQMLDASEEVAQQFEKGRKVRPELLADLLEFFKTFADECHHSKEEELLFPLLELKGIRRHGGPLGVMLHEHEEGRALIREMAEAAEEFQSGQDAASLHWARAARAYAQLLRTHICKENNVLFPMAERTLAPEEQTQLAERFEELEVGKMGAGKHQRLHAKMNKLVAELAAHQDGPRL